ncbi:MAG: hypothetical protein KF764_27345 [Labilithrix sp.]|nr:hypothetical protein [Labilithrix sp.]MBX3221434.1 hypothetical protein [Labilithrix sp.]
MRARLLLAVAAGALSSACFVVTDLGRFEQAEPLAPSNFSDLRVTVRGMTSHVNERFEYRVVDSSNVIQSRGFIIPLGGPAASFFVQGAVPKQNGPFRFDFYADHDNSGAYDPRPDTFLDHAWRLSLDDAMRDENGAYVVVFDHNQSFTNLNTPNPATEFGKPVTIHMKGMGPFAGKRVEVRVGDASTRRVVGMFRVPTLTDAEFDVLVPGMIETGVTYTVEVYTDDGKGGGVRAFRFEQLATEPGLEATFNGDRPADTPGAAEVSDPQPAQ